MQYQEIMEGKPNSVQVPNQSGTYKRFTSLNAPGVEEWRNSVDQPKGLSREERAAQQAQEKQKFNSWLMNKVEMALGSALDGIDPMDYLASTMDKYNLDILDIDNLMKKNGYKQGLYKELANMWDSTQSDKLHDAQNGHVEDSNQFYSVRNGQIIPSQNPYA